MKRIILVVVLLITPSLVFGQSTTVSGAVTDTPDGQTWNNGTITFTFSGGNPPYTWTGGSLNPNTPITAALSATGTYSVSVPDNNQIFPVGSQWKVTACPRATVPASGCNITYQTITGTAQTINLTPPSIRFNVPTSPVIQPQISAYADGEIVGGWPGFTYAQLGATVGLRSCQTLVGNCVSWGAAAGASPGGSAGQLQYNNSGAFGGATLLFTNGTSQICANAACSTNTISFSGNNILLNPNAGGSVQATFGPFLAPTYQTTTNCTSSASPAVCGSAAAGSVVVAAAATTVQVNTTDVTANSQILLTRDDSLGTKLSVTCNTATVMGEMKVSARTGGTSFTITVQTAPATNPGCISYWIVN